MGCTASKGTTAPSKEAASHLEHDTPMHKGSDLGTTKNKDNVTASTDDPASTYVSAPRRDTVGALQPSVFVTSQTDHFSDRYMRERKLGSGAYGEVLLCKDKATGAQRAVKIIKKSSVTTTNGSALLEEVDVVKRLDHPNIMKLYEFFDDKRNFYMVMELYTGGELFDEIINRQRFSEADAASIMRQVVSGVTYLHKHRIVHRDLKPENLLLQNKKRDAPIKIVDFGLSAFFDPQKKLKDRLGTAYYIAPEVLKKKYDEKCDIWSCGVILYILLCGYPPFGGQTDAEILRRVERGKFAFEPPEWTNVSEEAKSLIKNMLCYDPSRRISAAEILDDGWIKNASVLRTSPMSQSSLVNALGNMKKFQTSQKLAQAALLFIASKLITLEEMKHLTDIFNRLDTNGDGQLDREELVAGYKELQKIKAQSDDADELDAHQIETEVDNMLNLVDFDKNGYIEISEFVTACMERQTLLSEERLHAAFVMFDKDKSGKISGHELGKIIGIIDDETWQYILQDVDKNNDGEVDFEEFVLMMQRLCLSQSQIF